MFTSQVSMSGAFTIRRLRPPQPGPLWRWRWKARQFIRYGWRELPLAMLVVLLPLLRWFVPGLLVAHSHLKLAIRRADGTLIELGTIGRHLITTAGKNWLASAFANSVEPENLRYHGFGTGTNAAAVGDTALQTELTTQYASNNTRPTGSQVASTNTYTTGGTTTPDAAVAITEWGLFDQAANSGGTLFDRQVFSAINLNGSGDSLLATYVLTLG